MRAALLAAGLVLATIVAMQSGYLTVPWVSRAQPVADSSDNPPAVQPDAVKPPATAPIFADTNASPGRGASASGPSPAVDETALRYFAAKGDTKRLEAEIARLKALYPQWTPPENPLAVVPQGDPQLDAMWRLYSDGMFAELRKTIADRQTAEPNWQPPAELLQRLSAAEAREQLVNASDLKQYDAVIRLGSENPSLLTCGDVDVMWRVAEAFASTDRLQRAKDAYLYVLNNCAKAEERMATVQKALPLLARADLDALLATEKKDASGKGEFEPVRDELARKALIAASSDAKVAVAADDVARIEALARSQGDVSDELLLGWYYVRRDNAPVAETWFRKAQEKEDSASASQGLALALVNQGKHAQAEDVLYKWRNASDDVRNVYLAAVANLLAVRPPPGLSPEVLRRTVQEVYAAKDAASAQQFGWYADALNQFQTAEQWFATALAWKPDDEPTAYGLALMRWKLGDKSGVREVQSAWAGRSERIPTVGEPSIETAAVGRSVETDRKTTRESTARYASPSAVQPESSERQSSIYGTARVEEEAAPARPAPQRRSAPRGCTNTLDPSLLSPEAALARGWCLMDADRPVEAAQAFEVALRSTGQTKRDAAYGQSLAYLRAGLTSMAAVAASKAPMNGDRQVELRTALLADQAVNAYRQGRYTETLIALDERDRIAPIRNDLMVLRGYAYLQLKRFADAEKVFGVVARTGNRDALKGLNDVRAAREIVR